MKNVLLITSSPRGEASHSTTVATDFVNRLGANVTHRELWRKPTLPIGPAFVHAAYTPEAERTSEQKEALALSDELIAELNAADLIVVAAGMINFGMPATLKTWIDQVTRSGVTFRYSEAGPEGLIKGKKVILVLASGGVYREGPMVAFNHLEPPIRTNLGFIGLTDVETVLIDGTLQGAEVTAATIRSAHERADELAAKV